MIWTLSLIVLLLLGGSALLRWGTRWGSTAAERTRELPGDDWRAAGPPARVSMTRAISIAAPPEDVWPWVAQMARGAGWYSVDWLDNGRRDSARHLVSWIPEPRLGDATTIGYLRHLDEGRALAWWANGVKFLGARARLVACYAVEADGDRTRLVCRISADAAGATAQLALLVFRVIDSIMATRQLVGFRERIEHADQNAAPSRNGETGARDQYQLYEVHYADGSSAGSVGHEPAARWRAAAIEDGVLDARE